MSIRFSSVAIALLAFLAATGRAQSPGAAELITGSVYRLQAGDVIEVQYRYTPEFNQTVTVQPDGFIALSIGASLRIVEMTIEQAQAAILKRAGERLREPEIIVTLKEFQKPYFVVAGEAAQPGRLEMREKLTAIQAVMLAGGFKESARSSQILLFRKLNSDEAEVRIVDLRKIRRTADLTNDVLLVPGDMLFVPQDRLTRGGRFIKLVNLGLFFNPVDAFRR